MNLKEKIALAVVVVLAIGVAIFGLVLGIPKNELILYPQFDIPVAIILLILFILGRRLKDREDNNNE